MFHFFPKSLIKPRLSCVAMGYTAFVPNLMQILYLDVFLYFYYNTFSKSKKLAYGRMTFVMRFIKKSPNFFKTYRKIILLFLLPVIFSLINIFININIYYSNYHTQAIRFLTERLNSLYKENNSDIKSIMNGIDVLSLDNNLTAVLSNNINPHDTAINAVSDKLQSFSNSYKIIDSIAVINREQQYVVTNKGVYDFSDYFENEYVYNNYNAYFFRSFKLYGLATYQCQPPSIVHTSDSEKNIIPFFFCNIGKITTTNYIVVNIDIKNFLAGTDSEDSDMYNNICILNRATGQNFTLSGNEVVHSSIKHSELYNMLCDTKSGKSFDYIQNGSKVIIAPFAASSSILDYCYYGVIPNSNQYVRELITRTVVFNLLFIILMIAILLITLMRIISPLMQLENTFKPITSEFSGKKLDIFRYLELASKAVIQRNKLLYSQYNDTLPLIQEKQLIELLNSDESETEALLKSDNFKLDFRYNNYAAIMLRLDLTQSFYNANPGVNSNELHIAFYQTARLMFLEKFPTYSFMLPDRTICIILNLPDDSFDEEITPTLNEIQNMLSVDAKSIQFYVGYGGIYDGIAGMKKSFDKAKKSLMITIGDIMSDVSYSFSHEQELKLHSLLSSGHIYEAKNMILSIFAYNEEINCSDTSMKLLYINILFMLYRVMSEKKVLAEYPLNMIIQSVSQPISQIYNEIFKQLKYMNEQFQRIEKDDKISMIVKYIDTNYSDEISLDYLSDKYKINSSQISKQFKAKTGVNFWDYLSERRINRAKELIAETDLTIQDIYTRVGFNNRTTFIRCFKKISGMTPTEYSRSIKSGQQEGLK